MYMMRKTTSVTFVSTINAPAETSKEEICCAAAPPGVHRTRRATNGASSGELRTSWRGAPAALGDIPTLPRTRRARLLAGRARRACPPGDAANVAHRRQHQA